MESREQYYKRKHSCRFCGFKSHMIIHMHERYCEQNPKRLINFARRYGPKHLTSCMIDKIIRDASIESETAHSSPKFALRGQEARPTSKPQTVTVGVQVPDLPDFQTVQLSEEVTIPDSLDITDLVCDRPLPELTSDDVCAVLSSL